VLSRALQCPGGRHPGLCHYHVHLLEMAPTKALVLEAAGSAEALRSQWHEVRKMPSWPRSWANSSLL
jgi:hypothetical protein